MGDLARLDRALRAESKCELLAETLALVTTAYHEREAESERLRAVLRDIAKGCWNPQLRAWAALGEADDE